MRSQLARVAIATLCTVCALAGALTIITRSGEAAEAAPPTVRDPRAWPFRWDSIWNLPVGDGARLVPAGIPAATAYGMTVDEDVLVLEPDAPRTDVVLNTAGWNANLTRCGTVDRSKVVIPGVPIPTSFSTEGYLGRTPNMSAALLMADGNTVVQTQPFHRCGAGGAATSQYNYPADDLRNGDGIRGAHGGSGMSSLGGTIRLGELVPGGAIRHALKVNINCARLCAYAAGEADGRPGFRWPAQKADGDAAARYRGTNPALQMGSLLVLPPDFDESRLHSEAAVILARALRDHGAYVVDDTGWDVYGIETEWSPQGRVVDEFSSVWGFGMVSAPLAGCGTEGACGWSSDMATLFTSLHVVDDNGPDSVGGAGARRAPCAPAFPDGTGGAPDGCGPTGQSPTTGSTAPDPGPTTTATTGPPDPQPDTSAPPSTAPATTTTAPASTQPAPAPGALTLRTGSARAVATPLADATVTAGSTVYLAFVPDPGVRTTKVEFWLDAPFNAAPRRTETAAPYDFAGGTATVPTGFATGSLALGPHVLRVRHTDERGVATTAAATFTLAAAAPVAPTTAAPTTTAPSTTAPTTTGPTTSTTAPAGDARLVVSTSADRRGAVPLQGARVGAGARLYISLAGGAPLRRVSFWLDDPARSRPARQVETVAPYDLAGGTVALANAVTMGGRVGAHQVTAVAVRADGSTVVYTATFTAT